MSAPFETLADFRVAHPEYQAWTDDELAESLHAEFYADQDYASFRQNIGLDEVKAPPDGAGLLTQARKSINDARGAWALGDAIEAYEEHVDSDQLARTRGTRRGAMSALGAAELPEELRRHEALAGDPEAEAAIRQDAETRRARTRDVFAKSIEFYREMVAASEGIQPSQVTREILEQPDLLGDNGAVSKALETAFSNPAALPYIAAEATMMSASSFAEAMPFAIAGGLVAGPFGMAAGSGVGSARTEYRAAIVEGLTKEGVDISDPDALMRAIESPGTMERVRNRALTRASVIGSVDALTAGLANKVPVPAIKNMMARWLAKYAASAPPQGLAGAAGEALAQVATEGRVVEGGAVVMEAFGEALTGASEVTLGEVFSQAEGQRDKIPDEIHRIVDSPSGVFIEGVDPGVVRDEVRRVSSDLQQRFYGLDAEDRLFQLREVEIQEPITEEAFGEPEVFSPAWYASWMQAGALETPRGKVSNRTGVAPATFGGLPVEDGPQGKWAEVLELRRGQVLDMEPPPQLGELTLSSTSLDGEFVFDHFESGLRWAVLEEAEMAVVVIDTKRADADLANRADKHFYAGPGGGSNPGRVDSYTLPRVLRGIDSAAPMSITEAYISLSDGVLDFQDPHLHQALLRLGSPTMPVRVSLSEADEINRRYGVGRDPFIPDMALLTDDQKPPPVVADEATVRRERNIFAGIAKADLGVIDEVAASAIAVAPKQDVQFASTEVEKKFYELGLTPKLAAALSGAVAAEKMFISGGGLSSIEIFAEKGGTTWNRTIQIDSLTGELSVSNNNFFAEETGTGLGASAVAVQMATAARMGIKSVPLYAAKGKTMNGYYTWPRLGFNTPEAAPIQWDGQTRRLLDVFKERGGRQRWKEEGWALSLEFDTTPGSESWQALETYLEAKRMVWLSERPAPDVAEFEDEPLPADMLASAVAPEEIQRSPAVASIRIESFDRIGSELGEDAQREVLAAVADALDQPGVLISPRENGMFWIGAPDQNSAASAVNVARGVLRAQRVWSPYGSMNGIAVTGAVSTDGPLAADGALSQAESPRIAIGPATGETLNMAEYPAGRLPYMGPAGMMPINPEHNWVLGNGRRVRIPSADRPIRKGDIIARLQRDFGLRIYEGAERTPAMGLGTRAAGQYTVGWGDVRVAVAGDFETAAHEVGHFLADRHPWMTALYTDPQYRGELLAIASTSNNVHDGFAEYFRGFMTQEWLTTPRAPRFDAAFRAGLAQDPELGRLVYDLQEMMHAYGLQGALARANGKYSANKPPFWERIFRHFRSPGQKWDTFVQRAFDGLRRIQTAELDVTDGASHKAYTRMRLAFGGANSVLTAAYFFGAPGFRPDGQGLRTVGPGLKQIFGDLWGNEDLARYIQARRDFDQVTRARQALVAAGDNPARAQGLMLDDERAAWLSLGEGRPEFEEAFRGYQGFWRSLIAMLRDSGLASEQVIAAAEASVANFLPMHRIAEIVMGDTRRVGEHGNPFLNVDNVWDSIVFNTGFIIRSALINRAKRTLYDTFAGSDNQRAGLYASKAQREAPQRTASTATRTRLAEAMGLTPIEFGMANRGLPSSEATASTAALVNQVAPGVEELTNLFVAEHSPVTRTDTYYDGGEKQVVRIGDDLLWQSLKFLEPRAMNGFLRMSGAASALLRRGTTAAPSFQLTALTREVLSSWVLDPNAKAPVVGAVADVAGILKGAVEGSASQAYVDMLVNGGGFATSLEGHEVAKGTITNPASWAATYDRLASSFEAGPRLRTFRNALEAGASPEDAALLSRSTQTDFALRGDSDMLRSLAVAVPFLNARLQGLYTIGTQGLTAKSFWVKGSMLAAASMALYWLFARGDERYEDADKDKRNLHWFIPVGEGPDEVVWIPKPFEVGLFFGTIPEQALNSIAKKEGEEFVDAMVWVAAETFSFKAIPQVIRPAYDVATNRSWTGAPIVPMGLERLEPHMQFNAMTHESARYVGQKLNISPARFQYLVRGYLGQIGTLSLVAGDRVMRATVGDIYGTGDEPAPTAADDPTNQFLAWVHRRLTYRFYREGPPGRTRSTTEFWEMARRVDQIAATASAKRRQEQDGWERYVFDNQAVLDSRGAVQAVRREYRDLRAEGIRIRQHPQLTAQQKRERLWAIRWAQQRLLRNFVRAYGPTLKPRL